MSETRCLRAIRDRKPMSTNIFDLKRAEQAGLVSMTMIGSYSDWKLTPAGESRLLQYEQIDAQHAAQSAEAAAGASTIEPSE